MTELPINSTDRSLREIRDLHEDKLVAIPDYLNDEVASILLQGMTVEYLLKDYIKLKKIILFHAAAGGVGLIASQWAKSIVK